jgi:SAM-dependent methyltransferase
MQVIGSYRNVSIVMARRVEAMPDNTWHIPLELLVEGLRKSPQPHLLRELVDFAVEQLGFFSRTASRMYEYPWAITEAGEVAGMRLLEIGAGVNPLPLWFASRGGVVTTVDSHPQVRAEADRQNWNEWGFLDYSLLNRNITSLHCDMADAEIAGLFDLVYSVSVLEHAAAHKRRQIFRRVSKLLRPGGRLLLTLDLVPGKDCLWNLCEGMIVEDFDSHGDLQGVVGELTSGGFCVRSCQTLTGIPQSRTDIAFIKATRI